MIILGTNSIKDTGFDVANSCRFNHAGDDRMDRTVESPTLGTKWTFSTWVKKDNNGDYHHILTTTANPGNWDTIRFSNGDALQILLKDGATNLTTTQVFRDNSAFYSIIVAFDSTQGTASNRLKLYINGTQVTSFSTATYPTENLIPNYQVSGKTLRIGANTWDTSTGNEKLGGVICETIFIDGVAHVPTDFGEFDSDSGIWKPLNGLADSLTFGTNGFYLDYQDSSALGNDVSGNNNDFSTSGLSAIDQSTDTCTNNSATIGTLFMGLNTPTFSEGNLQSYSSAAGLAVIPSSIGLANGKWYAELKYAATSSNDNTGIGINMDPASSNQQNTEQGGYTFGYAASTGGYTPYQGDQSGSGPTYTVGDIMGIYMDLDNMKLYFSKNGTLNSSTGLTINVSNTGFYYFCVQDYTNTSNFWTWQWNFGAGCPFAISSGNTDANGYGNFEYSPTITGDGASKDFFACNTKNLAEYG